uniref:Secreted protein n=1 Tax=Macrostomum lignano TaxID=282301 RepID=A0A1I8HYF8_9PLAT
MASSSSISKGSACLPVMLTVAILLQFCTCPGQASDNCIAQPWRSAWTVAEDFRIARSVMRSIRQTKSVSECIARMKFTWKPNRSPQVLVDEIECVSKKPWLIECKPFNLTFPVMNLGHDEVLNNEATANKPFYCKQYVKSAPNC